MGSGARKEDRAAVVSTAERETESGAEELGLQGVESGGGAFQRFKRLVQGRARSRASCGRGSCTAACPGACTRAAPEPPAAPPAAPRAPPPGEPGTGQGNGREGGKQKGKDSRRVSGRPRGLRGGTAAATPLVPASPTLASPCAWGSRSTAFLLLLPKSPGRGASPRPGQQAAA